MELIIPASQVQVGDFVRFALRNYFFNNGPKWREYCERTLVVKSIRSYMEGKLEFFFDDKVGTYRGIDQNTEIILVHRPEVLRTT